MQERCGQLFKSDADGPSGNFTKTLCPGLCSGHGDCKNSTCICSETYTSIDCSIDKSRGPTVTSIRGGNTCDLQTASNCHVVGLLGSNFMKTSNSACRATKLKVEMNLTNPEIALLC